MSFLGTPFLTCRALELNALDTGLLLCAFWRTFLEVEVEDAFVVSSVVVWDCRYELDPGFWFEEDKSRRSGTGFVED